MKPKLEIIPYKSVGSICFDMSKADVYEIFKRSPNSETKRTKMRSTANWDNVSVKFSSDEKVEEITFVDGTYKPFLGDLDLLDIETSANELDKTNKHILSFGFKVYSLYGLALTDDGVVCVFSKSLLESYCE